MKYFQVEIKNGETITIPARDTDNVESWLRDQLGHVVLNGTTYSKADIVSVGEVRSRRGSTNMNGV